MTNKHQSENADGYFYVFASEGLARKVAGEPHYVDNAVAFKFGYVKADHWPVKEVPKLRALLSAATPRLPDNIHLNVAARALTYNGVDLYAACKAVRGRAEDPFDWYPDGYAGHKDWKFVASICVPEALTFEGKCIEMFSKLISDDANQKLAGIREACKYRIARKGEPAAAAEESRSVSAEGAVRRLGGRTRRRLRAAAEVGRHRPRRPAPRADERLRSPRHRQELRRDRRLSARRFRRSGADPPVEARRRSGGTGLHSFRQLAERSDWCRGAASESPFERRRRPGGGAGARMAGDGLIPRDCAGAEAHGRAPDSQDK